MDASSKNGRRTVVGTVSTVFSYNPDEISPFLQCRLSRSFGIVSSIAYRILPSRFIPKDKQESSRSAGETGEGNETTVVSKGSVNREIEFY